MKSQVSFSLIRLSFTLILITLQVHPIFCQKENNTWVFGFNAGLNFNTTPPTVLNNTAIHAIEGCSSISDKDGNLLFYTNGETVWNRNNQPMPNGTGLVGYESSSQSSVIVPFPDDCSKYYIFTTDGGSPFGIPGPCCFPHDSVFAYSVVDMSLNNGSGDITEKNVVLLSPVNECVAAVKDANGRDYWVLTFKFETNLFYAFHITPAGVSAPIISKVGQIFYGEDNLRFSPNGKKVATSSYGDVLCIFDFNSSTGKLSNMIRLPKGSGGYGICFSPNSNLIYISSFELLSQINLSAGSSSDIFSSKVILNFESGYWNCGIQNGPDGKMYVSYDDHMYVIQYPNIAGKGCQFEKFPFHINSTVGLPNFVESYSNPYNADFTFDSICLGDTTRFESPQDLSALSYNWNFGDPGSGSLNATAGSNALHLFNSVGEYEVQLTKEDACGHKDSTVKKVSIITSPTVSLPSDTIICIKDGYLISPTSTYANSYLWNTGETTEEIKAVNPGSYSVIVKNACGTAMDEMELKDIFPDSLFIPNLFTPNGDSLNDSFIIDGLRQGTNINIINRWGALVFKSTSYSNTWKGDGLSEGTYFYDISHECSKKKYKGWIELIK